MPNARKREILPIVLRRVRATPVVAIQGARQTGKSFMVRELLKKEISGLEYRTFDDATERRFAEKNPSVFLRSRKGSGPLVIDEAQKVPEIFNAIKLLVDEKRVPAQFVLTGSTEFSHRSRIQESLTGRMTTLRVFPFGIAESLQLPPDDKRLRLLHELKPRIERDDLLRHLARGGLPGIFSIRDDETRRQYMEDWLELTWGRDIHQVPRMGGNSVLSRDILFALATLEIPDVAAVTKSLRAAPRSVRKQLDVLETLFVVHRIRPHRLGAGRERYFLCDAGLAARLGAPFSRQLQTWLYQEALRSISLTGTISDELHYYVTSRGSVVDLILKRGDRTLGVKLLSEENIDRRELLVLSALEKRSAGEITPIALGPTRLTVDGIEIFPWEVIA